MLIIHNAGKVASGREVARFAERARNAARLRGEVTVVLTSDREMRALNRQFRGKDKSTDVLSFPPLPNVADEFSGDIVISTEMAARNARRFGHGIAHELKVLVLHGMLHLAGYDHESDDGEMARREERLGRELGLRDGLIHRAGASTGQRRDTSTRASSPIASAQGSVALARDDNRVGGAARDGKRVGAGRAARDDKRRVRERARTRRSA